jgi:hemerythrin-like domain-containing protein
MPVQIGAKTHSFSDPTGLLSDCHRRIESFLGALAAVGRALDAPPSAESARALDLALRYFQEAAPKHRADEEDSLFPRLRKLDDAEMHSALVQLEHLEEDHRAANPPHADVDRLGRKYLAAGKLTGAEVNQYRRAVASLRAIYEQHIRLEDEVVFPLAKRVLPEAEKSAIAAEMADRRAVRLVTDVNPPRK